MRLKYRENMTPAELDEFMKELAREDQIHMAMEREVPMMMDEQSLDYFNRYIAGDR